jgi:hypothetical protein
MVASERVSLGGRPSKCPKCGAAIRWCRTDSGKRIAIDFISSEAGIYVVSGSIDGVDVVSRATEWPRFSCHFDTCTAKYRKSASAETVTRHGQRYKRIR